MQAILKSLQHGIDASVVPTSSRNKVLSEYLDSTLFDACEVWIDFCFAFRGAWPSYAQPYA
jgi:hypothetical protein